MTALTKTIKNLQLVKFQNINQVKLKQSFKVKV